MGCKPVKDSIKKSENRKDKEGCCCGDEAKKEQLGEKNEGLASGHVQAVERKEEDKKCSSHPLLGAKRHTEKYIKPESINIRIMAPSVSMKCLPVVKPFLRTKYRIVGLIGKGRIGVVYKAESKEHDGLTVAIKGLKITNEEDKKSFVEEVKIMKMLDHTNIVKYYEEMHDGPYFYIVTEYCSGGSLLERIAKKKEVFKESEAAVILEKILRALCHCHAMNVAHRDITPDKILYADPGESSQVKLIDFGLAKKSATQKYNTVLHPSSFSAPEVASVSYTKACDMWSVGVLFYIMLSGELPYQGKILAEESEKTKSIPLVTSGGVWEKVSPPAIELIKGLLDKNYMTRLTPTQALTHIWFERVKSYPVEMDELDKQVQISLSKMTNTSNLWQSCMKFVIRAYKESEIDSLTEIYQNMDIDKRGYITKKDFVQPFLKRETSDEVTALNDLGNCDPEGKINYTNFISSAIDALQFIIKERFWAIFRIRDKNDKAKIPDHDVLDLFRKITVKERKDEEILAILKEHKLTLPPEISFEKFFTIFQKIATEPDEGIVEEIVANH